MSGTNDTTFPSRFPEEERHERTLEWELAGYMVTYYSQTIFADGIGTLEIYDPDEYENYRFVCKARYLHKDGKPWRRYFPLDSQKMS